MFECLQREEPDSKESIGIPKMIQVLEANGFLSDDPRWKPIYEQLLRLPKLDKQNFAKIFSSKFSILSKVFLNELIIPDFLDFTKVSSQAVNQANLIFDFFFRNLKASSPNA